VLPEGFSALNVSKNDGFQDQKKVLAGIPARTIYQNSILRGAHYTCQLSLHRLRWLSGKLD